MYPILLKIGNFYIHTYGVMVALGVMLGYLVALGQAKRDGISEELFSHILFWSLIWSFAGARLLFVILEWRYFFANPSQMILSRDGFIFYGGVFSGAASLYFLTKKHKVNFLKLADASAIGLALGHGFGRIGCFATGCCYGKPSAIFGMLFPKESPAGQAFGGVAVIPTQLIEAIFLFALFFILSVLKSRKRFDGQTALQYVFFYGIFRFIIEFFRGDPRGIFFGFSTSQSIALAALCGALGAWRKLRCVSP